MEEEKTTPAAEDTAAEAETEAAEAAEEPAPDKKSDRKLLRELSALEKKLGEAEKEKEELADKHLRLAAEYDNFRRRAAAERTAAYTDGLEGALEKLLPILSRKKARCFSEHTKFASMGMSSESWPTLGATGLLAEAGSTSPPSR